MKNFNKIYKIAFGGVRINNGNFINSYNEFVYLLVDDEFKDDYFIKSWRWSAQQEQMNYLRGYSNKTPKQFLKEVYEAYNHSK